MRSTNAVTGCYYVYLILTFSFGEPIWYSDEAISLCLQPQSWIKAEIKKITIKVVIAVKSANSFFFFLNLFRTREEKKGPYKAYSMWHPGSVLDVYMNHYLIFTIITLWNTIIIIPIISFYREGTEAHTDYVTCLKSASRRALIWASEVRLPRQLQEFSLP